MEARYQRLKAEIEQALEARPRRTALYGAMKRGRDSRVRALKNLPATVGMQERVRAVKERCLERQAELLERFCQAALGRGAHVYFAQTGAEAIAYILDLARRKEVRTVAKSKSLTSEEIEVNHPLEANGIEVIETDLGELIIQKVHEKPYHLVFPAVHKTAAEVAEIFRNALKEEVPNDIDGIMHVVRRYLRPIFLNADMGMTGANVGIAETGAIVIETNEGNARMVSTIPDLHVCIMGIEKIVETIEDALLMMLAHPVSAVGQMLTTYVTVMAGRSPLGNGDEEKRESHIVILDNGRTALRKDRLMREALHCIRCGACMNVCPTYGVVGGHSFGYIYPGPIGIPWTAAVHGLEKAGDFAPLCISCGLCKEICPAHIDIPMMIAEVKTRDAKNHRRPAVNEMLIDAERMARLGSATAPISNWLMRNKTFRAVLEKTKGIDRRPELPPFARRTFMDTFKANGTKPRRRVAYFVDMFANVNRPDLGHAAAACLERAGCEVIVPEQRWSAYPAIGYGDLERAREAAAYNVSRFAPLARKGYDIVATEPTAAYCLKVAYPTLLDHSDDAMAVAGKTWEFFEYLMMIEDAQANGGTGSGNHGRNGNHGKNETGNIEAAAVTGNSTEAHRSADGDATATDRTTGKATTAHSAIGDATVAQSHTSHTSHTSRPLSPGAALGFHISCHQRPLGSGAGAVEWLRRRGWDVQIIETGTCCGMGGTFGMKHGALGRDLAMAVGEPLFDLFKAAKVDAIVTESSVCAIHLREGTGLKVFHPLEFLGM